MKHEEQSKSVRRALAALLGLSAVVMLLLTLYALAWVYYGPSLGAYSSGPAWAALGTALGTGLTAWGAVQLWKGRQGRGAVDTQNLEPDREEE